MLLGKPLCIDGVYFKHPKIGEILEVGESFYNSSINIFTLKPSDLMVNLYDIGMDYRKVSNYELFILLCGSTIEKHENSISFNKNSEVSKSLSWLTGIDDFHLGYENNDFFLFSDIKKYKIDKSKYNLIRKYYMDMTFRTEKEKYNPGNEKTFKFLINEERKKQKKMLKNNNKSELANQISSIVWSSGIKFKDVEDLYLYQLYDGLNRINKIKNFDNIYFGYYSGNIQSSDFKRIKDEINWMD